MKDKELLLQTLREIQKYYSPDNYLISMKLSDDPEIASLLFGELRDRNVIVDTPKALAGLEGNYMHGTIDRNNLALCIMEIEKKDFSWLKDVHVAE